MANVDKFFFARLSQDAVNDCRLIVFDEMIEVVVPVARAVIVFMTSQSIATVVAHPYIVAQRSQHIRQAIGPK